ncbi:MAG: CvpA family protein [Desulfobulbaceae bacterium]|jgi:membrane protein required for colicin V production|nr:CvpA family protein [Desulfobulbaceae bacterium]
MQLTAQFTIYDYCVLVIFALFIIRGLWQGFIGQIIGLLALYVGFLAAGRFSGEIAPWIRPLTDDAKVIAFLAWIVAFALAWLVVALVGKLFMKLVRVTVAGAFDRLAGAVLGFLKAALLIVIIHMLLGATLPASNNLTRDCVTCPTLDHTTNFCRAFISDPKTRDAFMRKVPAISIETMKHYLDGAKPTGESPSAAPPSAPSSLGTEPAAAGGLPSAQKPDASH